MTTVLRVAALVAALTALLVLPGVSLAAARSCGGGAAALNEYCEAVPGAAGPVSPGTPGQPGGPLRLGKTLPPRILYPAYRSTTSRRLLSLPAAYPRTSLGGNSSGTGSLSLLIWPLLGLIAVALAAAGGTIVRRRRLRGAPA